MSEREDLIINITKCCRGKIGIGDVTRIADFIIKDRERIVRPLVELNMKPGRLIITPTLLNAIEETIILALRKDS